MPRTSRIQCFLFCCIRRSILPVPAGRARGCSGVPLPRRPPCISRQQSTGRNATRRPCPCADALRTSATVPVHGRIDDTQDVSSAHAFVDESEAGPYLVCAVLADPTVLDPVRRDLRELRKPGQRRLHMVNERHSRRREILSALHGRPLQVRLYQCGGRVVPARRRCLQSLVADLVEVQAESLVLEQHSQERNDRQIIHAALQSTGYRLRYRHEEGSKEPMLWAADALTWAYARGGDWRRRMSGAITAIRRLDLR